MSTVVRRDTSPNLFSIVCPGQERAYCCPSLSILWRGGGSLIPWDPPHGDLEGWNMRQGMGTHVPKGEISRVRQWTQLAAGSCGLTTHRPSTTWAHLLSWFHQFWPRRERGVLSPGTDEPDRNSRRRYQMDFDAHSRWYSPLRLSWYDLLAWDTISETPCRLPLAVSLSRWSPRCLPPAEIGP